MRRSEPLQRDFPASIEVLDSHTEGEPTRVVLAGWPQPDGATMAARRDYIESHQDHLRRAVVCEPRGHEAMVGALLTPPVNEGSVAGVIFFNNVGCLGMCGHGLIGVVRTLQDRSLLDSRSLNSRLPNSRLPNSRLPNSRLPNSRSPKSRLPISGRIETAQPNPGEVRLDTPVGTVSARLAEGGAVEFENVPASCLALDLELEVEGLGRLRGDVAWGGNGFFLAQLANEPLELANLDRLLDLTRKILDAAGKVEFPELTGRIDHVELFGPAIGQADSRNFVLCPGGEYDRSPCGTGTSAKLAVLHARGQLDLGQRWRQESITGGCFTGWLEERHGQLIPTIRGRAWTTSHAHLRFAEDDPLRGGFSPR